MYHYIAVVWFPKFKELTEIEVAAMFRPTKSDLLPGYQKIDPDCVIRLLLSEQEYEALPF